MTTREVTMSSEALDWLRQARLALITAGPEGHTGNTYWNRDGSKRCVWGRIVEVVEPGHRVDSLDSLDALERVRYEDEVGLEIDDTYELFHGRSIDRDSSAGYVVALAGLEDLILAASRMPDWVPSPSQGSQHV